jgi:ribosomal protein S18 acetylase RimI-like enzyme
MSPSPGGVAVRPATPTDLPALGRLGAILVRTHHDLDANRYIAATSGTEAGYASFLGSQISEPAAFVLVAEVEGEVVGYAYGGLEDHNYMALRGPAGVVHDLVVDPAWRGRGAGGLLLKAVMEALEALGAPQVVLSTAEGNVVAQRMFTRAGFRRTMVEMTRDLRPSQV